MAADGGVSGTQLRGRLERYLDAVPRSDASAEPFGSLILFARIGPSGSYYARPTLGHVGPVTPADLEAVRLRQRELRLPEAVEWVDDTTPSLRPVAEVAGLVVESLSLMVLVRPIGVLEPSGVRVRIVPPDDPGLAAASAVAEVGFGAPGTATGEAGVTERDVVAAAMSADWLEASRGRMRRGSTVMAVAEDAQAGPLCVGWHRPVDDITEVVGIATLPSARRRGLAAAVAACLVADALGRGVATVFLTAGSDAVARVYTRVGFERIGTACIAAPLPTQAQPT